MTRYSTAVWPPDPPFPQLTSQNTARHERPAGACTWWNSGTRSSDDPSAHVPFLLRPHVHRDPSNRRTHLMREAIMGHQQEMRPHVHMNPSNRRTHVCS